MTPVTRQSAALIYAVYDHPTDFPNEFVCRRWGSDGQTLDPGAPFARGRTLAEIHRALPLGLIKMCPWANDDPVICELWI